MGERSGVSQRFYVVLNLERDGLFLYLNYSLALSIIHNFLFGIFIDKSTLKQE